MTNKAFMRMVDYVRQKHHVTIQRLCDDIGTDKKEYDYYLSGIKTPPAFFVLKVIKYFGLEEF